MRNIKIINEWNFYETLAVNWEICDEYFNERKFLPDT